MPFDDNEEEVVFKKNLTLKDPSPVKSMLESSKSNKSSPQDFERKAKDINKKSIDYKNRAAELAVQFKKNLSDKTLPQNKNMFANEVEKDLLMSMVNLASEINEDENEPEGSGNLGWITILLKSSFFLRDKINIVEYENVQLQRKMTELAAQVEKLQQALDSQHKNG